MWQPWHCRNSKQDSGPEEDPGTAAIASLQMQQKKAHITTPGKRNNTSASPWAPPPPNPPFAFPRPSDIASCSLLLPHNPTTNRQDAGLFVAANE
ncbi:hypothetical protein QQP08_010799 [Theobroma cacao]|nr:hypothetical protein QQP08_010799 [Theobroma cacao]